MALDTRRARDPRIDRPTECNPTTTSGRSNCIAVNGLALDANQLARGKEIITLMI